MPVSFAALIADPALRKRTGVAGREALSAWDWKAATLNLRNNYYLPVIENAERKRLEGKNPWVTPPARSPALQV